MGAGSTEAEVIPVRIEVDATPVDVAKGKLAEAQAALRGFTKGASAPTYLEFQTGEARASIKALTADIKAMERASKDADKAAVSAAKATEKGRDKANALAVKGYQYQKAAEADDAAKTAALYESAGAALSGGAALALKAALAIGAAGAGLVIAGIKTGIEATATKQKNIAVLDRLTKGQGEIAESVSKQLAGQTGVSEEKAMERVKGLIQAKFNRAQTEDIFRASADIGEVKGEGKAELFIKTLEKVQFAGKASEKSVKALFSAGVEESAILAGLQRTGESIDGVRARLKAGKVTAEEFSKAATGAVQKDIGGVAGKGLDAMVNRLKIGFGDLFDGMDEGVGALEGLGGLVGAALGGPEGVKLKEALSGAGNEILGLVKNVTAADLKALFSAAGSAATTMAAGIKAAAGAAADLWNITKQVSGRGSHLESAQGGGGMGDAEEAELFLRNKAFNDKIAAEQEKAAAKNKAAADEAAGAAGVGPAKDAAAVGGYNTGKAYADGFAQGVGDNADKGAAAGAAMVGGAVKAGAAAQKSHSPSEVMAEKGDHYVEGYAGGIKRTAGQAAAAGADMVGRTVRAGGGAGAGAGAQGGAAGGPSIVLQVYQTLPAGSPEVTRSAARQGAEMSYPALLAMLRQAARDGQLLGVPSAGG